MRILKLSSPGLDPEIIHLQDNGNSGDWWGNCAPYPSHLFQLSREWHLKISGGTPLWHFNINFFLIWATSASPTGQRSKAVPWEASFWSNAKECPCNRMEPHGRTLCLSGCVISLESCTVWTSSLSLFLSQGICILAHQGILFPGNSGITCDFTKAAGADARWPPLSQVSFKMAK